MAEKFDQAANNNTDNEDVELEGQAIDEADETQAVVLDEGIIRMGRISAFGPSLDGGFGIND